MPLELNTNSYVTVAEADSYLFTRTNSEPWAALTTAQKESYLVTATSMLDQLQWYGESLDEDQPLSWPRRRMQYIDESLGRIVTIEEGTIPNRVKRATFELALHILLNPGIDDYTSRDYGRISVGPIELEDKNFKPLPKVRIPSRVIELLKGLSRNSTKSWWRAA
jgi:hypothetical protein